MYIFETILFKLNIAYKEVLEAYMLQIVWHSFSEHSKSTVEVQTKQKMMFKWLTDGVVARLNG